MSRSEFEARNFEPASSLPRCAADTHPADAAGQAAQEARRTVRHRLRTPVNHILSYSQLLLDEADELGLVDCIPEIEAVRAAGQEVLSQINDLLEPSSLQNGERRPSLARTKLTRLLEQINRQLATLRERTRELANEEIRSDLGRIESAASRLRTLVDESLESSNLDSSARNDRLGSLGPLAVSPREAIFAPPTNEHQAGSPIGNGVLLVVDDNEPNRVVLARSLERLGYTVLRAENGRRALEVLQSARVDLVLLDIMMPEMDGYQVLEQRQASPSLRDIPFIMISALDELESVVRCVEMGAEDYLPKPFDPVLLRARIGACLEKKRFRDQEVEYLRQVARVTVAAAAVEAGTFDSDSLAEVAERADELGHLARVFQRMAREVSTREQDLKQQLQQLRIDIDQAKQDRQVAEITESEYFRDLQEQIRRLRAQTD